MRALRMLVPLSCRSCNHQDLSRCMPSCKPEQEQEQEQRASMSMFNRMQLPKQPRTQNSSQPWTQANTLPAAAGLDHLPQLPVQPPAAVPWQQQGPRQQAVGAAQPRPSSRHQSLFAPAAAVVGCGLQALLPSCFGDASGGARWEPPVPATDAAWSSDSQEEEEGEACCHAGCHCLCLCSCNPACNLQCPGQHSSNLHS